MKSSILPVFVLLLMVSWGVANSNQKENKPEALVTLVNRHEPLGVEEKTLAESQRCFDRSLSILNTTVTAIGHVISLFALIVVVGVAFGVAELSNWKRMRKEVEKSSEDIKTKCIKAQELVDKANTIISGAEKQRIASQMYWAGVASYNRGEYPAALKSFEDATGITQDNPDSWSYKGLSLFALHRDQDAIEAFEKAIKMLPTHKAALENKGRALCRLARYGEALPVLESVVNINNQDDQALGLKGLAQCKLGMYDAAIQSFDNCIAINKNIPLPWLYKACINALKQERADALINLTTAMKLVGSREEKAEVVKLAFEDKNLKAYLGDVDFKTIIT